VEKPERVISKVIDAAASKANYFENIICSIEKIV
jgi:hypothetical protein